MNRRRPILVALLLVLAAGCGKSPAPSTAPPGPPFDPASWRYPGAAVLTTIAGAPIEASDRKGGPPRVVDITPTFDQTTTPDAFESVFAFYAKKLEAAPEYVPGKTDSASTSPPTMTDTKAGVPPLLTGSIVHAGRHDRDRIKTATLIKHDAAGDVVVILSRGEGEDVTTVELLSIRRPPR